MIRSEPNVLRTKTFPGYFFVTFPITHESIPAGSFFISLSTISVNSSGRVDEYEISKSLDYEIIISQNKSQKRHR